LSSLPDSFLSSVSSWFLQVAWFAGLAVWDLVVNHAPPLHCDELLGHSSNLWCQPLESASNFNQEFLSENE
jgi:hypothetical protein